MSKNVKRIIFILAITLISSIPIFLKDGIFQGHDTLFHLFRVNGVIDNLSVGKNIPVYFNYLHHFGYGNGLFYPDLFLYIPAFFYKIGFSFLCSYKIFIVLINLFSLISIYICIKKITKNEMSSKIGVLLYGFSLYRFTDVYLRGALGESISFIFLPFVILGIYMIFYDDYHQGYYLSIGLIGLMFSHVITTYVSAFIVIIFCLINFKKMKDKKILLNLFIPIFLSIVVTSYFWMPMLEQLISDKFNIDSNVVVLKNYVPIFILLMDFEITIFDAWLPPGIGLIYYIWIFIYVRIKKNNDFIRHIYILLLIFILFVCFKFFWKIPLFYSLFSIVQFPWRLYEFITLFIIIIVCYEFNNNNYMKIKKITLIYISFVYFFNVFLVIFYPIVSNKDCLKNEYFSIMFGEYLPIEMKESYEDVLKNKDNLVFDYVNDDITYEYNNEKTIVNVVNKVDVVELPLIYYKGYKAVDGEKVYNITKSKNGYVEVDIDDETDSFVVFYEGTKISKISKKISFFGFILFLVYLFKIKKR